MTKEFEEKFKFYQDTLDDYIKNALPSDHEFIGTLLSSMRYSLLAGGKRLRPVLMFGTGELFGCSLEDMLPFAAGIEMIHTYSLIHDDLPAMDNDDFRRGKLTNHKVYGEAMAILSGDGLLNYAYESMLKAALNKTHMKYVRAIYEIAAAAGIYGMVGGQVVDLESEENTIDYKRLEYMHNNKTGALICASVRAGAIISGAGDEDLKKLTGFARALGMAFQIIDDILDVVGDENKLGKKTGSDANNNKATYTSIFGLEKAVLDARKLTSEALDNIRCYGNRAIFLNDLTEYLLNRDY